MSATPTFLDLPSPPRGKGDVAVIPLPYEGTVSWGAGTAAGPAALLEASTQVEEYDQLLGLQISDHVTIRTWDPPAMPAVPEQASETARRVVASAMAEGAWPVAVGGEHSLSLGVYQTLAAVHSPLGVIQLDAHADLRDSYQGEAHSHACVMARIRECTDDVLQLGIRSLSLGEARRVREQGLAVAMMHDLRQGRFELDAALDRLPSRIFLTLDVDALDLSLVRATGTPEPGGFGWDEMGALLGKIFAAKEVVGVDLMELCGGDRPSAFCAARLAHHMIGLRFAREVNR